LIAPTTGLKIAEYTIKISGWLRRTLSGTVIITRPENNKAILTEWVQIEGTHSGVAGGKHHYWLMTTNGVEWWPSEDIKLNVNGKWESRINVGKAAGPRVSTAAVVRVTPAIHALLTEVRRLRHKANDYAGIKIPQSNRWGWDIVHQVDVQIPPGEVRASQTS
jgi:hypothetical protein